MLDGGPVNVSSESMSAFSANPGTTARKRMKPITDRDREDYGDLARRLYAAWMSHKLGNRGVDYVQKKYAPDSEPIGDLWIEIAMKVEEYATERTRII
jgi:hypothetical protein